MECCFSSCYGPSLWSCIDRKRIYLIPPAAAALIHTIALVAALYHRHPYWAIPPGAGLCISIYYGYLSIYIGELKDFAANNAELRQQIAGHQANNQRQETLLAEQGTQIEVFQTEVAKLNQSVSEHKQHIQSLVAINMQLQKMLGSLQEVTETQQKSLPEWQTILSDCKLCLTTGQSLVALIQETLNRFLSDEFAKQRGEELHKLRLSIAEQQGVASVLKEQVAEQRELLKQHQEQVEKYDALRNRFEGRLDKFERARQCSSCGKELEKSH